VRSESGKPLVDRYAIQPRDKTYFMRLLKTAAGNIFKAISRMSQGITNAYQFNVDLKTIVDSLDSGMGIMYIFTLPDNFDNNILSVLDTDVEDAIRLHVLMDWYKQKGLRDISLQTKFDYEDKLLDIKQSRLMSAKSVERPYNIGLPAPIN
jgi:hypothetical protein